MIKGKVIHERKPELGAIVARIHCNGSRETWVVANIEYENNIETNIVISPVLDITKTTVTFEATVLQLLVLTKDGYKEKYDANPNIMYIWDIFVAEDYFQINN